MQTGLRMAVLLLAMLAMASVVSSCGRKGNLEDPPSQATVVETDEQGRPINKEERKTPDRPFILDGLI